mgnify:CR=1 FL=1
MKITLSMLEGACEPQRALFAELFGQEVELTLELCIEHAAKFNWCWAAQNLLPPKSQAAYDKALATASEAYDKAHAPASEAYYKAIDSARAAYNKAIDSARAAYNKAIATAFFNAATMEEK